MFERPPRHSVQAISAKRAGGKKVPKQYRKYHQKHKKSGNKKESGHIAAKVVHNLIKGMKAAFEAL